MASARGGRFVLMSLRGPYAPEHPELDRFLFAAVGDELDGIPLSVLSALSRLGLDPRVEAARLSDLAIEAATEQLARMIARLPGERWTSSEIRSIAAGLVELLPRVIRSSDKIDESTSSGDRRLGPWPSRLLMHLALAGAALMGLIALAVHS